MIAPRVDEAACPAFDLSGVTFSYGDGPPALCDVSLCIRAGERVALLGANGCGKSTLLRVLDGLLFPSSGTVRYFGRDISEQSLRIESAALAFRRQVGFMFQQSDAQLFNATVREDIAFGPLQMGMAEDEIQRRIADLAAMLGIERLLDRAPFRLSGGEKKKVALASTLVTNPQVLLMDEPTAALDPRSQQWLIETLDTLHAAGKTLVVATHDLDSVEQMADTVVVMNDAHRVERVDEPHAVLSDFDFLLRMNLVHEHSHRHGDMAHTHVHHHDVGHEHEHEHEGKGGGS